MYQHPIPQNVTAYEFHLIGNMTLKQFIELGAGIGVGVFFYALPFPSFIKWPLIAFAVLLGAAMAFMPFDGRPLDRMIVIFIKAINSPTQYIWRKDTQLPNYFTFKPKAPQKVNEAEIERLRLKKNLDEYLKTLPGATNTSTSNDEYSPFETSYMQNINSLFQNTPAGADVLPGNEITLSIDPKVRVRKLKHIEDLDAKDQNLPDTLRSVSIAVPQNQPVAVMTAPSEPVIATPDITMPFSQPESTIQGQYASDVTTTKATTNTHLPIPKQPDQPNTLVGMVLDHQGKIVDNAIIEIRDEKHVPVRALKTNTLGQFFSASPLQNGNYEIEIEKPGLVFDVLSIKLNNKVIAPLEIRSKNLT